MNPFDLVKNMQNLHCDPLEQTNETEEAGMPKDKDVSEKILEDHNDVFADTVNVLLFGGQEVLQPDELENAMPVSQFRLSDGLHEQERDVVKRWRHGKIVVAAFGFENETAFDPDIPLRIISYDGAVYKEQVNRRISARRQGQKPAALPDIAFAIRRALCYAVSVLDQGAIPT